MYTRLFPPTVDRQEWRALLKNRGERKLEPKRDWEEADPETKYDEYFKEIDMSEHPVTREIAEADPASLTEPTYAAHQPSLSSTPQPSASTPWGFGRLALGGFRSVFRSHHSRETPGEETKPESGEGTPLKKTLSTAESEKKTERGRSRRLKSEQKN